jgi:hypothetical protein
MTKARLIISGFVVGAALSILLLLQQWAIGRARAEQSALRARQQELTGHGVPAAQPELPLAAIDAARRDRVDLERLRRETASLRGRIFELSAQAKQLAEAQRAAAAKVPKNISGTPLGATIAVADARDVGQATPAALVQSWVWAMTHGDTNRMAQLMSLGSDTDTGKIQKLFDEVSKTLAEGGLAAQLEKLASTEIRLLDQQPAGEGDLWLVTEERTSNGGTNTPDRVRIRLTDTGWRLLIGTNGEPVTEKVDIQP